MFLTKSRKVNLDASDATARARKAAQVTAQNAANAARAAVASAQATAQSAALKSQAAAQSAAQKSSDVAQKSQAVAQNAGSTAQTTAAGVTNQVKQGVFTARKWAAPKLESVADYATTTVAPTVSSALHNTADYATTTVAPTVSSALRNTAAQVRPAEPVSQANRRMAAALKWTMLGAAITAAGGAVAAVLRYRNRAAANTVHGALGETTDTAGQTQAGQTPTAAEPKTAEQEAPEPKAAGPKPGQSAVKAAKGGPSSPANPTETVTEASANGHGNTNGW